MSQSNAGMDFTRRQAVLTGLVAVSVGAPSMAAEPRPKVPSVSFVRNRTGDGFIGPYGEVRTTIAEGKRVPIQVLAAGGLAAIDLSSRTPFIRLGAADKSAIMLTSAGIQFGTAASVAPWSRDSIAGLVATLERDLAKARGAMLLRSTMQSTFPIAAKELKGGVPKALAVALSNRAKALAAPQPRPCNVTTVTEEVVTTITRLVDVWRSAEQQYQACLDREMSKDPCRALGPGALPCAVTICAVGAFVDVLVGTYEIVETIVDTVTRTVIDCGELAKRYLTSPWDLPGIPVGQLLPQPAQAFGADAISDAKKLLDDLTGFLGPLGECLLGGTWSLAQFKPPLQIGRGSVAIPYGVRVCISAKCARALAITNVGGEIVSSWAAALGVLAALSAEFAAFATTLGVTAAPAAVAAVAAAGGTTAIAVQAAAILLAFIILVLIYGTAISAQLAWHESFTDSFADGVVCIEHPSFVLAMIKVASMGLVGSELVPPIVTG